MEYKLIIARAAALGLLVLVRLERGEESIDAFCEAIVDDALILQCFYLMATLFALLVNLGLFCADKRFLVDIGVYFDVAVVGELEGVLCRELEVVATTREPHYTYPLAVVDHHDGKYLCRVLQCCVCCCDLTLDFVWDCGVVEVGCRVWAIARHRECSTDFTLIPSAPFARIGMIM